MTKIVDAKDAILGRLAAYAAKESLKGESVVILNCDLIRISGNKNDIIGKYYNSRRRMGTIQRGPKKSKTSYKYVKKVIRGMLPEHRWGRGKEALKRVICYNGVPSEFENANKITLPTKKLLKFMYVKELLE